MCVIPSLATHTTSRYNRGKEGQSSDVATTVAATTTRLAGSARKRRKTVDDTSVIHRTVMRMMDPLLDQEYTVYTDQFYTSGSLFKELYNWDTMACGTDQKNRKGVPPYMKNPHFFGKSP